MNAIMNKTNTGKLLVAVLAMFMIVAGAAVVLGSETNAVEPSGVPAEPTWADAKTIQVDDVSDFGTASSNVITISKDTVFNLTADIGSADSPVNIAFDLKADMKITANEGCEIYIQSTAGQTVKISAAGVYFEVDGATVTLDGNADGNTVLNTNASDVSGVFKVCNGGILNVTHTKGASTLAVANTHETYVVVDNAILNIDGANAFQVPLFVLNKADVNVNASEVATPVGGYVDATDSTIDITNSTTFSMLLFSADLTNSKITADKTILFYGNGVADSKYTGYAVNTIILDATSSITAPNFNFSKGWGSTPAITANSTVTFDGEGTVSGDFKVPTDTEYIGAYNFNNVKVDGSTEGVTTVETSEDGTSATINPVEGTEIDTSLISGAFADTKVNTVTISSGTVPASGLDLTSVVTSGDTVVLGSDVVITSEAMFTIPVGVSIDYSTSVPAGTEHTFSVTANGSTATFKNFSGDFSVTGGSIVVSGNGTGIIESADDSEVEFTGNVSGSIQVSWTDSGVKSGKVTFDNATISSNCTITLDPTDNITYSVNGELRVYGTIDSSDKTTPISINVPAEQTVKAYASATIGNGIYFEGAGDIDLGSSMSTGYWSEDIASDMTWSQAQKTIIDGSMTIKSGYTLTVLGELVIDENVTVTIEKNAVLQIGDKIISGKGSDITAVGITVNGTIEVEQGGEFNVMNATDVTVTGQLYSEGIVYIDSNVTVKSGGSIVIDESYDETSASKINVVQGLTIEAGGSITVSSEMTITEINNKGTVNLVDAILTGPSTIYQVADGAVVNIDSVTGGKDIITTGIDLRVTDVGLVFETDKDTKKDDKVTVDVDDNAFSAKILPEKGFGGIVITESVVTETINKEKQYSNYMYLSGDIEAIDESDKPSFCFSVRGDGRNDGGLIIGAEDSLTLGKGVTMMINDVNSTATSTNDKVSVLYIDGTFTAVEDPAYKDATTKYTSVVYYVNKGDIEVYVSGMATTNGEEIAEYINAFHYETTGTDGAHYYTTLATALANATQIDYYGDVEVMENVTVPSGVRITANSGATMTVGDADNRDIVLTVADGGIIRNGDITVNGTLVFEKNKDGNKGNDITSHVQIDENPKMTFTNVYTALNNATTGKVEIRQDAKVILNSDIEVKEGVTLVIPDSATVTMYNGVTLTVNGTVENSGSIINGADPESGDTPAGFNPMNGDETNTDASKIVVNGAFKSMDYTAYEATTGQVGYYIPGAYYQIIDTEGSWYWITPVEDAAAVAADVDDGIAIYGEVTVGDVTFAGSTEKGADPVEITVNGKLTAGTITLDNAAFVVPANVGQYDGTVSTAVGSVAFVNVRYIAVADTVDADDNEIMVLAGTPAKADLKGADTTVTVATGNVTVIGSLTIETYVEDSNEDGIKSFTISDGATVTVMDASGTQGELKADNLTVNGTLVAIDEGNVNVTGTLTVRGTFTVAEKTDDNTAGTASVNKLLIGIAVNDDGEYGDASAGTVNADNIDKLASVVMSAESTFSGKQVESMKPTEFYLEDTLWITAYAGTDADTIVKAAADKDSEPTYYFQPADMTESKFIAWNDKDGKAITASTAVGQVDAVYADIQYDVFKVYITLDNTVGSVAIDGQMLVYENGAYALPNGQLLTAGQHTVSYTLAANYEGTPTLSSQNVTVSGLTFTLSGDFEDGNGKTINYYLSLGGATLADQTVVIEGGNGGSDNLGLTDYLLIILVILIVVMAIMVAMRLMRS